LAIIEEGLAGEGVVGVPRILDDLAVSSEVESRAGERNGKRQRNS
jgi:hypothetical protein